MEETPTEYRRKLLRKSGHDMKSLLCSLVGFSSLMLRRKLKLKDEEQETDPQREIEILRQLNLSGERLTALVDDLHAYLKSEMREFRNDPELIEIGPFVEKFLSEAAGFLLLRKQSLALDHKEPQADHLSADPRLLREELFALLLTVTRLAEEGSTLCLQVSTEEREALFCFRYEGISLSAEEAEAAGSEAVWIEREGRKPQTTGVALPSAFQLAKASGAKIRLLPSPEGGCFELRVPAS